MGVFAQVMLCVLVVEVHIAAFDNCSSLENETGCEHVRVFPFLIKIFVFTVELAHFSIITFLRHLFL